MAASPSFALLTFLVAGSRALRAVPPIASTAWVKEAEIKHGRVALLALPALVALGSHQPEIDPVKWLNARPLDDQLLFYSFAGVLESFNLRRFGRGFRLKEGEEPGKLLPVPPPPKRAIAAEVVSGRLAMLACFLFLFRSAFGTPLP